MWILHNSTHNVTPTHLPRLFLHLLAQRPRVGGQEGGQESAHIQKSAARCNLPLQTPKSHLSYVSKENGKGDRAKDVKAKMNVPSEATTPRDLKW